MLCNMIQVHWHEDNFGEHVNMLNNQFNQISKANDEP